MFVFFQIVFGSFSFWIGLVCALAVSVTATVMSWSSNEKRFRNLVKREMDKGEREEVIE